MASEVIRVRRANMTLRVPADMKAQYLAQGYNVIDAKGKVIEHNTKEVTFAEHKAALDENAKLNAEIAKLKAEIVKLKARKA